MPYDVPDSFELAQIETPEESGLAFTRTEGGLIITSRRSDAYLSGRMVTRPLEVNEYKDLRAFLNAAVQRNRRLDFVHPKFVRPMDYTLAQLSSMFGWSGLAGVVNLDDLFTPRLSGLPVGLQLRRGDCLSFRDGLKNSYKTVESDTLVASNSSQAVPLTSRLGIGVFSLSAAVHFVDPVLRFMVVPDTINDVMSADELFPSLSLDFVEVIQ